MKKTPEMIESPSLKQLCDEQVAIDRKFSLRYHVNSCSIDLYPWIPSKNVSNKSIYAHWIKAMKCKLLNECNGMSFQYTKQGIYNLKNVTNF